MELTSSPTNPDFPTLSSGDITTTSEQARSQAYTTGRKTVGTHFVDNPRMTCRDVEVYYGEKCHQ